MESTNKPFLKYQFLFEFYIDIFAIEKKKLHPSPYRLLENPHPLEKNVGEERKEGTESESERMRRIREKEGRKEGKWRQ